MDVIIRQVEYKETSSTDFISTTVSLNTYNEQYKNLDEIFDFHYDNTLKTGYIKLKQNIIFYETIDLSNGDKIRFNSNTYVEITSIASNLTIDGDGFVIVQEAIFFGSFFRLYYAVDNYLRIQNVGIECNNISIAYAGYIKSQLIFVDKHSSVSTDAEATVAFYSCFIIGTPLIDSPFISGTYSFLSITDCFSKCNIINNENKNFAGFVSIENGSGVKSCKIERSFFAGQFNNNEKASGIISMSCNDCVLEINKCYSICDVLDNSTQYSMVHIKDSSGITLTINDCYSINKTSENNVNAFCIGTDNVFNFDLSINGFYTTHKSVIDYYETFTFSNVYAELIFPLYTANTAFSSDLYNLSTQTQIDASLSEAYVVDDKGVIKGFPLLKCFTDTNGVWEPQLYQNFNSETRQKIFVQNPLYVRLFDNSVFDDANLNNISGYFTFSNTDLKYLIKSNVDPLDYKYKTNINILSNSISEVKYIFNDISFDILDTTNELYIIEDEVYKSRDAFMLEDSLTLEDIFATVNNRFFLTIGTYDIDIESGLYVAFEDASSNTGKNEDMFTYTGNSRYLQEISTRINTKDADGNDIDSVLSYYTGKIYLNVKDKTPIHLHYYTIDRSFDTTSSTYVNKTKFQVSTIPYKINNLKRDKFYTISYYGTDINNIVSDTYTSYNRVRKAEVQVRSKLFQKFVNIMRLRGVQEFNEIITLLIKERRFVNPDITDGVDYNLLDVLMGNFPDEFIIYGYTIFDVIQEMIRSKNEPLSQKDVYYLRDLIRIYSKYFRIFTNDINKLIQYPSKINDKLKTLMNNVDFHPSHNIYNDTSYSNINDVENLSLNSERLKLFEGLYDEELHSFLQRTNTANISNLQLLYPPKKDNEINALIQRDIYDVPPKIRFEDYSPNYIFFKDVSSILQKYNTRKKAELSRSDIENSSFASIEVASFTGKSMKLATVSDNGQNLFAILDNSFVVFEISNNKIINPKYLSNPSNKPNPDATVIERVYVSNDGNNVFMYTTKDIFMFKDINSVCTRIHGDDVSMTDVFQKNDTSKKTTSLTLKDVLNTELIISNAIMDSSNNIWLFIQIQKNYEATKIQTNAMYKLDSNFNQEHYQNVAYYGTNKIYMTDINETKIIYFYNANIMQFIKVHDDDKEGDIYKTYYLFSDGMKKNEIIAVDIVILNLVVYDKYLLLATENDNKIELYIGYFDGNSDEYPSLYYYPERINYGITSYNHKWYALRRIQKIPMFDNTDIILNTYLNDNDIFNMDMLIDNNNLYFSVGLSNYRKNDQKPIGIQYIYKMTLKDPPENNDLFDTNSFQNIYTQVGEQTSVLGQRTKLGGINNNHLYVQLLKENPNNNAITSEIVIHDISGNSTTTFTNKSA